MQCACLREWEGRRGGGGHLNALVGAEVRTAAHPEHGADAQGPHGERFGPRGRSSQLRREETNVHSRRRHPSFSESRWGAPAVALECARSAVRVGPARTVWGTGQARDSCGPQMSPAAEDQATTPATSKPSMGQDPVLSMASPRPTAASRPARAEEPPPAAVKAAHWAAASFTRGDCALMTRRRRPPPRVMEMGRKKTIKSRESNRLCGESGEYVC